jgi:hypothetical protein
MEVKFSPQTIEALAFVISGGSADDTTPMIGLYRSGPKLERFMRSCNVDLRVGSNSRLPALTECLIAVARGEEAQTLLPRIIEAAADPRDFSDTPEKVTSVVEYLNSILRTTGSNCNGARKPTSTPCAGNTPLLHKWTDWAKENCTFATVEALHRAAAAFDAWYVYFGVIKPEAIVACTDMQSGEDVPDWATLPQTASDVPGVPAWRRHAWHSKLLKNVARQLRRNR